MTIGYEHLKQKDRIQIQTLWEIGFPKRKIARELKVSPTTIRNELNRNKEANGGYCAETAQKMASDRRYKLELKMNNEALKSAVEEGLNQQHSPEQIAGRLKKTTSFKISHEAIYQYIWADKEAGGSLYTNLRHAGKKYNKRAGKTAGRGLIPRRVDIKERPPIVEEKARIGDFEADLIIGAQHKGALLTIVDRNSKFVKIHRLTGKTADEVTAAIKRILKAFKIKIFTITFDNGKEFARHYEVAEKFKIACYFATPYHSWERGLNEHTNGLIRQYFPKAMKFDTITCEDVQRVENALNHRPRKILKFATPHEVFTNFIQGGTLQP